MKEPSVLDYFISLLTPWKGKPLRIPDPEHDLTLESKVEYESELPQEEIPPVKPQKEFLEQVRHPAAIMGHFPVLPLGAVGLAVIAQIFLEPPDQNIIPAVILYISSAVLLGLGFWKKQITLPELENEEIQSIPLMVRLIPLFILVPLFFVSILLFRGNLFTPLNLLVWLVTVSVGIYGLYIFRNHSLKDFWETVKRFVQDGARLHITTWGIFLILTAGLLFFFRFFRLDQVPGEMFSDHAEKLWDVADVLSGKTSIFFERNTGREAFQMYLTAFMAIFADTKISFMSLKLGTALAGFFTLPYIYLLGKQIGGKWVGWFALFLAGVAYWPNVISRIGLRFPLYPLFVAPTLFYLIRGLMRRQRNDFIWAGIALGIGLHGYSPIRLLPVVIIVAIVLYVLHRQSLGNRTQAVWALLVVAFISFLVFLPLLTYALEHPAMFGSRAFSRLTSIERPFTSPVGQIFLENFWKSAVMFFYNNGNIWVHSVPNRPALDVFTAAFYFIGLVLVIARYIKTRHWLDLFLLVSIPLLMLPSTLSLAFPEENPSLNRSGGAIIPVFILAAIGLDAMVRSVRARAKGGGRLAVALATTGVLILTASSNFNLVFNQFDQQFILGAWNTSQIGRVIRGFAESTGSSDTAYVIPYPHWVDTRLVGINAGNPLKDYALQPDQIETTLADSREKMFILKPEDAENVDKLLKIYPAGSLYRIPGTYDGKDFLMFVVPAGISQP